MTWVAPLAVLGLSAALLVLAASLAPKHHILALALSATGVLALPWLAGPVPLVRGVIALVNFVAAFRVIDLVRTRPPWTTGRRIVHALSFLDSRLLRRERPRLDLGALVTALAWGAVAALAFHALRDFGRGGPLDWAWLRFGAGLVFAYAAIDAGYATVRAGYRALGFVTPPLHVWPVASTSVTELWGARWARPVSRWLRETCFVPLLRRGHPVLGVWLGFAVSAFGHAYPVLVALGPTMAGMMFGYFMVQGVVVIAESRLGVSRWPRAWRRSWTIVLMVVTSPLFVAPCHAVLEVG